MPEPEGSAPAARPLLPESLLRWIPAFVFIVAPGVLILWALRNGGFLFGIDIVGGFYHLRGAIGKALAQGRLPVWDPHVMCGAPLLAGMHGGVLYPLTWPAAFLSPGAFWTLTAWVHLSLSGAFAFAWLGRGLGLGRWSAFAGALLFMLSGFLAGHIYGGHVPHVSAVPWAAAVLWRLERFLPGPTLRRGMFLAAALALMILAGFPQFVLITGFAVLGRLVQFVFEEREGRKERAKTAALAVASLSVAGLLAAPQLLPTLELVGEGQRISVNSYDFVTSFSVAPSQLLTLFAPMGFGDNREIPGDSSGFVGIAGLGLAALGLMGRHRQRYLWAGLAAAGLLLAMGHHTPLFRAFFHAVPGVSLFRVPGRYLLLFTLAAAPLAALGFERLRTGDEALRRHALWIAGIAGALMVAAAGFGFAKAGFLDRGLLWSALSFAAVAGLLLAQRASRLRGGAVAAAFVLLMAAELWGYNSRYFAAQSAEDMEWPPDFVSRVRNHPRFPFRIATVTAAQQPAIGKCQLSELDHIGGYDPMMLRRYTELVNVARGKPASDVIVGMVLALPGPLFDLLGARVWIVPGPRREPPGWKTVGELPSGFVYENPQALPRAFLVGRSTVIESAAERLKFLTGSSFDARRDVVLESGAPSGPGDAGGAVQLAAMEPGYYSLKTECPADAVLVLSEAYYPGWTAEVDGKPAELLRADHLLQAVRLPAGQHDVRFSYRSRFLGLGFALAALGVLLPLGIAAIRKRKG